ncbi:MAG: DUF1345 domain-containing protein [Acidimicrobiales bacterium]
MSTSRKPSSTVRGLRSPSGGVALRRALLALAVGLAGGGFAAAFLPWQAAALLGWDGAAILFATKVWATVLPMSPAQCAQHALREDPSRAVADSVVLLAAVASLASVGLILAKAADATGGTKAYLLTIGVVSVVLAWGVVHTIFTLRYTRIYYKVPDGGVDFNEKSAPDYADFAYLAFTIGMTFQVSDTNLTSKAMRRTALRHALISYLFGAVIIGLIINVVASLLH